MPRFISMKSFGTQALKLRAQAEFLQAQKTGTLAEPIPLGQIIGHVIETEKKVSTLPNGEVKESVAVHGKFEGIVYATGEVVTANTVYLPPYFAEEVARTKNSPQFRDADMLFAIEIQLKGTGAGVPVTYEVVDQAGLQRSRPLERLKAAMAAKGVLRVPVGDTAPVITHDDLAHDTHVSSADGVTIEGEVDDSEVSETATKRPRRAA